jgi:S1-C subfamily serine protease
MSYDLARRPTQNSSLGALLLAVLIGAALGVGSLYLFRPQAGRGPVLDPTATERPASPRSAPDADEEEAIRLFKAAKDSVVNVDTLVLLRRRLDMRVEAQQTGTGSGFFWDDDGRIVTNYHVIRDAARSNYRVRVVLADRSAYEARVIGASPDHDLAVVQITAPKEKVRKIAVGRSNDLEVGQKAYAIGNPFGLSLTMTKGIISALDRQIDSPSDRTISGAIQTDAPINPGNSGGPLLDKDGRLIGVNTSIASPSGGNVGIGFAIPVDTVNAVVTDLIRQGRVRQPDIGVKLVDQRLVRRAGFPTGVMIRSVTPDGPAAAAGLKGVNADPQTGDVEPGDLIVAINETEVGNIQDYQRLLGGLKIGDKATLTIERGDKRFDVVVVVGGI